MGTMGTRGTMSTTAPRRGAPRAPPSPFRRRRRQSSPDLFLSWTPRRVKDGSGSGGRAGGGMGSRRERGERRCGRREGEERRAVLRLLFLGEGDEGALASSSPISRRCHDGSGGVAAQTTKHKHHNN